MKTNKDFAKYFLILFLLLDGSLSFGLEIPDDIDQSKPDIIGEAYEINGDKLLYTEFHYTNEKNLSHWVRYKDPDDKLLVNKYLGYQAADTEPNVSQRNYLCGEVIDVLHEKSNKINIAYQADDDARQKQKKIKRPKELVIDAGFNQYLQDNWDGLVAGDEIVFEYLAPSQLKTFPFVAKAVPCEVDDEISVKLRSQSTQCFTIAPKKWWMKLALDPIQLTYASTGRQLLSFEGMGNIADEKCDYMEVTIRYQYPNK